MKVSNKPDFSVNDATCKEATGKTLAEWFGFLDERDGLKLGRRNSVAAMYSEMSRTDMWWPTTIYVEYERLKGVLKKDGLAEGYAICCTKTIAAPVEKTYGVWTDPKTFAGFFCETAKQHATEGGSLACDCGCKATFTRVRENKDLRFTWEHPGCTAPMTVDVQFQDNKGKTLMNVMTSRIQTRDEADSLRDAWGQALNRLKALAES